MIFLNPGRALFGSTLMSRMGFPIGLATTTQPYAWPFTIARKMVLPWLAKIR
jgi:hypothetical protein